MEALAPKRNSAVQCTFCGASLDETSLFGGRNGHVCTSCIGEAFRQIAASYGKSSDKPSASLNASTRCLICDDRAPSAKLIVYVHPWCLCDECAKNIFSACVSPEEETGLKVVQLPAS